MAAYARQPSSMEMASVESEFTQHQISNFRQAFNVFDVNKDGRISQLEIFETLQTMGNDVSEERRLKITRAMETVDKHGTGQLNFPEFIQFMKIMDEHNKVEQDEIGGDDAAEFSSNLTHYMCCTAIAMSHDPEAKSWCGLTLNPLRIFLVSIIFLAQLVYGVYVAAEAVNDGDLIFEDDNAIPRESGCTDLCRAIRVLQGIGIIHAFLLLLGFLVRQQFLDHMKARFRPSIFCMMRIVFRQAFILNGVASGIYLYTQYDKSNEEIATIAVDGTNKSIWTGLVLSIQVVTALLTTSPYFWTDQKFSTGGFCKYFLILWFDILYAPFRVIFILLFNILAILVFIPNIFLFLWQLMHCCCRGKLENGMPLRQNFIKFNFWIHTRSVQWCFVSDTVLQSD